MDHIKTRIPVIIVSYNNAVYVENTVRQLSKYSIRPIIIDNASDSATLLRLREIESSDAAEVVYSTINWGHKVGFLSPIFEKLPDVFAYSDPDLEFNRLLPQNFLEILEMLTERYRVFKAGFALDLLEGSAIIDSVNPKYGDVRSWESQYWRKPLIHEHLEVWAAEIDTTFAVYNKKFDRGRFFDAVRVARDFSAIHLPWFPDLDLFTASEYTAYATRNKSSTWVR